jgi:hypothetical protein
MYEDIFMLKLRVERLNGARTFSQKPKSRCHHVLSRPFVDEMDDEAGRYVTTTFMHYVETRLDEQFLLALTARHELALVDGSDHDRQQAGRHPQLRRRLRQHPACCHDRFRRRNSACGVRRRGGPLAGPRRMLNVLPETAGIYGIEAGGLTYEAAGGRSMRWPTRLRMPAMARATG